MKKSRFEIIQLKSNKGRSAVFVTARTGEVIYRDVLPNIEIEGLMFDLSANPDRSDITISKNHPVLCDLKNKGYKVIEC